MIPVAGGPPRTNRFCSSVVNLERRHSRQRGPAAAREVCDRNTVGVILTKGRRQCPSWVVPVSWKRTEGRMKHARPVHRPQVDGHFWVVPVSWKRAKSRHMVWSSPLQGNGSSEARDLLVAVSFAGADKADFSSSEK
jgi:hypothetical protein